MGEITADGSGGYNKEAAMCRLCEYNKKKSTHDNFVIIEIMC